MPDHGDRLLMSSMSANASFPVIALLIGDLSLPLAGLGALGIATVGGRSA
jgi:hypothetical protein